MKPQVCSIFALVSLAILLISFLICCAMFLLFGDVLLLTELKDFEESVFVLLRHIIILCVASSHIPLVTSHSYPGRSLSILIRNLII